MSRLSNETVRVELSNQDFLELPETNFGYFLLPHEYLAIRRADDFLRLQEGRSTQRALQEINLEGDATNEQDTESCFFDSQLDDARIVKIDKVGKMIGALVVGYPDVTEARATIGSRVSVIGDGEAFRVDIVGCRDLYPDSDDVEVVDLDSPLAIAILGKTSTNQSIEFGRGSKVEITNIDQVAFCDRAIQSPLLIRFQR